MMNRCLMGEEEPGRRSSPAPKRPCSSSAIRASNPGCINPAQILEEYEGGINAFLDPSKRIKGISTGFTKLDEMTGGLHGGDLIIIAARPSMGKTALALNIAQHVATR